MNELAFRSTASLLKTHSLFALLRLKRAYVTQRGRLVGVVALREFRTAIERIQNGELSVETPDSVSYNDDDNGGGVDDDAASPSSLLPPSSSSSLAPLPRNDSTITAAAAASVHASRRLAADDARYDKLTPKLDVLSRPSSSASIIYSSEKTDDEENDDHNGDETDRRFQ